VCKTPYQAAADMAPEAAADMAHEAAAEANPEVPAPMCKTMVMANPETDRIQMHQQISRTGSWCHPYPPPHPHPHPHQDVTAIM